MNANDHELYNIIEIKMRYEIKICITIFDEFFHVTTTLRPVALIFHVM